MPTPAPALPAAKETVAQLQAILVDLISLSLQAKQLHWNVRGPFFKPLHETFDAFTDAYRDWYDDVAERTLALGSAADGRLSTVARLAQVEELPTGPVQDREAVTLFVSRLEAATGRIRSRLDSLGEQDLVTQDMVIGIVHGLEKQAWMLRVQVS